MNAEFNHWNLKEKEAVRIVVPVDIFMGSILCENQGGKQYRISFSDLTENKLNKL